MRFQLPKTREEFFNSAIFATATTVLGLLTGFFGSVYSNEILSAFPFYIGQGHVALHAVAFWLLLFAFGYMFYSGQRSGQTLRREELVAQRNETRHLAEGQRTQQRQTRKLEKLLRTLPPEGFLTRASQVYAICEEAIQTVEVAGTRTADDLAPAIRLVIEALVSLAFEFDGRPHDARYAGNVMTFAAPPYAEIATIRAGIKFVDPITDINLLKGVLKTEPKFSTATDVSGAAEDPHLAEFYLPVPPSDRDSNGLWNALPGAPMAFVRNRWAGYHDSSTLSEWCDSKGNFKPEICRAIAAYFSGDAGKWVRSFISIPLCEFGQDSPFAVLNIHRDSPGMLRSVEPSPSRASAPAMMFFQISVPMLSILARLLRM